MSNFQSYSTYEQPAETNLPVHQYEPARVRGEAYRVTMTDGAMVEETIEQGRGTAAELNPYHGTEHFGSTARDPRGLPVTELRPDTRVTLDGVEGPISFFEKEGRIVKGADGTYSESTATQAEPEADTSDVLPMRADDMERVNAALHEVPQASLDGLAAAGAGAATGRIDDSVLVQKFAQSSGLTGEESHARVATIKAAYQAQADAGSGVAPGDLAAFWQWARTTKPGQLHEAVTKQLHFHDVGGYRALAAQWKSTTAPSIAALKAAGIPVRKNGSNVETFINGSWMSPGAAARSGLI